MVAPGGDRRSGSSSRRRQTSGRRASDQSVELIAHGQFCIDERLKAVFIADKRYSLPPKEYELLKLLLVNHDRVMNHREIIGEIWPGSSATDADCKQYIHLLRKRIEPDYHKPRWIKTIKGFGYRLLTE